MTRRLVTAGVACLAVLATASCTAVHGVGHTSPSPAVPAGQAATVRRAPHCARHRPQPAGPTPFRSGRAPGIGLRPETAVICEYEYWPYQNGRPARLTGQVALGPQAAAGLAAVVDSAVSAQRPQPMSCGGDLPRHAHAVVVLFGNPGSLTTSATVSQPSCDRPGDLAAGGRLFWLPWPVFDALMAPAADSAGNNGPRAPGLVGLGLAAAAAAARRHGLALQLSGVITDARAPLGSVLYQGVPAGAPTRLRDGSAVRVIVAVRPAPACTRAELRLAYRGNGDYRGRDWGAVVISDAGRAPCRLTGSARITGLGPASRPATASYTTGVSRTSFSYPTASPLILSPQPGPIPDGLAAPYGFPPPPDGLTAAIRLEGYYGTAASARSCKVIRAWRVVIGGVSRTVPNTDPAGPDPIFPSGPFVSCTGRLSASLSYYGLLTY